MDLMSLPLVMQENIFLYLSYDEIAKNRLVSKQFNEICSKMLNRGFLMIERRHAFALKNVKGQLPRRESERRYHQLSRHCDILTSIETRISMLNMTYSKFIDHGMCCFIPGKVIDEIRRVLHIVETESTPPRAHEVLQELRDISSMAIEHFDDKISPAFRKRLQEGASQPVPRRVPTVLAPCGLRKEINSIRRGTVLTARLSLNLAAQYKLFYLQMMEYKKVAWRQHRILRQMMGKQREQDSTIADLKKRIEECDIKYSELTHTNQAAGGKAIAATSTDVSSNSAQPLRHFSSQIKLDLSVLPIGTNRRNTGKLLSNMKPRKPVIKLPSLSEDGSRKPETPSSSQQCTPKTRMQTKTQATMAKIRGITNEIRHLTNLTRSFESKLKRPAESGSNDSVVKKQKMD